MTKEDYQQLREKPEIPMDRWYEFYIERGGFQIGLEKFTELFTDTMLGVTIGKRFMSLETALRQFYQYYNKKFDI